LTRGGRRDILPLLNEMGLLVDPEQKRVHVYRQGCKVQVLKDPKTVSCDPVLPGFALDLREIW